MFKIQDVHSSEEEKDPGSSSEEILHVFASAVVALLNVAYAHLNRYSSGTSLR